LGYFRAEVPTLAASRWFFHAGLYPLVIILIIVLVIIFAKNSPAKKILLLALFISLLYCYHLSHRPENFKYLGDTTNLNVTATVKEQIDIRSIINGDLSKTIMFTSTNTSGSRLYSLQNETRTNLDEVLQYTYGRYLTNLSFPQDNFPLMMITQGY